jgi:hypothetical protein
MSGNLSCVEVGGQIVKIHRLGILSTQALGMVHAERPAAFVPALIAIAVDAPNRPILAPTAAAVAKIADWAEASLSYLLEQGLDPSADELSAIVAALMASPAAAESAAPGRA